MDDYEDEMFDAGDLFDMSSVHRVPMNIIIYFKSREEPLFAEHVFFFQKEDPVENLDRMMGFAATWWDSIVDDKNTRFIYLTDRDLNKKAVLIEDVVAASFITPDKPDWMPDEQNDSDPS